jgi:hypothetical protein
MANVRVPVLVIFEYDDEATTGPNYGDEPMTPEFIREYIKGAGEHLIVPSVTVCEAEIGKVRKTDEDGKFSSM